jgi:hypothetical protein
MSEDIDILYKNYMKYAAVAAGLMPSGPIITEKYLDKIMETWNPLNNTEDAIKLAIHLGLIIDTDYNGKVAVADINSSFDDFTDDGEDKEEAIRRVIVRAASSIGKTKYDNSLRNKAKK